MSFRRTNAALVLEDGSIFEGRSFGADVMGEGEIVFTTTMIGYQEVATDPSFRGQIVCMTYPLIGNYGVNDDDVQSRRPWITGMVVREYCDEPNYWRSTETFASYLKSNQIAAISDVDTRKLTRHIRSAGAMRALLVPDYDESKREEVLQRAREAWSPADGNVVADVTTPDVRSNGSKSGPHVVVLDCGVKEHIVESLERRGVRVTVVPYDTSFSDIVKLSPDGVLTSPGPGDPENADPAVETVAQIVESRLPYFGVCLGHQLLALAIGASTSKLKFGHRGGNHPVIDLSTKRVYITSQNHGYEVDGDTVPVDLGWDISMVNLNDGSIEGLRHRDLPVFSVQYHPEGSPGPQDNQYLFDEFVSMIAKSKVGSQAGEESS